MPRFFLAGNPSALRALQPQASVEAEFGKEVVEGSIITWAHHGPRCNEPPPCSHANLSPEASSAIGVVALSHLDLDALGGCAALLGLKPDAPTFWELAAFVDVNGPHKLSKSGASAMDLSRLYAWWAWNESHKVFPERGPKKADGSFEDGPATDVSPKVMEALAVLQDIIAGNAIHTKAGEAFKAAEAALNESSFRGMDGSVIMRSADGFTNHLYVTPVGDVIGKAVVALNTKFGSVTLSFADECGLSACDIVQEKWGPLAGGHRGIAGSPRGQAMTMDDVYELATRVSRRLNP